MYVKYFIHLDVRAVYDSLEAHVDASVFITLLHANYIFEGEVNLFTLTVASTLIICLLLSSRYPV